MFFIDTDSYLFLKQCSIYFYLFLFITTNVRRFMMKKLALLGLISIFFAAIPMAAFAQSDILGQLDSLSDEKTMDNYKKSMDLCLQALKETPGDFDLNWRCAKACRWYGELAKRHEVKGWKDVCAKYGKEGMKYAQTAMELQPDKPHGFYWYALNVGIYSDGVSILTALAEGLKGKTQESFEKAYEIDKMHERAGAILGLGRFWYVLPWPMNDKKLALKYYREYQNTRYFGNVNPEGPIYLAELLIKLGGSKNKAEANTLLMNLKTDDKYFLDWKERLLTKLK